MNKSLHTCLGRNASNACSRQVSIDHSASVTPTLLSTFSLVYEVAEKNGVLSVTKKQEVKSSQSQWLNASNSGILDNTRLHLDE